MALRKYFTFIELLIITAILSILISLIIPSLNNVYKNVQMTECKMNLKNMFHAISFYIDDHDAYLPGPIESSVKPIYRQNLNFTSSGIPFRWNQKLPSYLRNYMEHQTFHEDNRYSFNETFICPGNKESKHIEGDDYRTRPYYITINQRNKLYPFGRWIKKDADGIWLEHIPSVNITEIAYPATQQILKDILDSGAKYSRIPDFPVHPDFRENILFLDGRVPSQSLY